MAGDAGFVHGPCEGWQAAANGWKSSTDAAVALGSTATADGAITTHTANASAEEA